MTRSSKMMGKDDDKSAVDRWGILIDTDASTSPQPWQPVSSVSIRMSHRSAADLSSFFLIIYYYRSELSKVHQEIKLKALRISWS